MLTECRLRACTFHEAIVELRVLANQARDPVAERKPREQHAMELSFDPGALAGSATP